jgi:hypothetical protein
MPPSKVSHWVVTTTWFSFGGGFISAALNLSTASTSPWTLFTCTSGGSIWNYQMSSTWDTDLPKIVV